jgi:putative copper resistance protein D
MSLNPLWDITFALFISIATYWYWKSEKKGLISNFRQILFYLGMFLLAIVLVGPIPRQAIIYFYVHMIQHILIMMLISPLIILGSPIKLILSQSNSFAKFFKKISKFEIIRSLFKPQIGFAIFLIALITTHFSPLANAAMNNPNLHCLELIIFLTAGLIYYYPVMEGNPHPYFVPHPVRVGSLFAMMLPETMTGFFLYSGNTLLHTAHNHDHMSMSKMLDPLRDQHIGGALMWSMGMIIDSMWIALAARDWWANEKLISGDE